jgi:hypothetical protein
VEGGRSGKKEKLDFLEENEKNTHAFKVKVNSYLLDRCQSKKKELHPTYPKVLLAFPLSQITISGPEQHVTS